MASELASSKWLLPQIDLHRWEEVFQVGTGITPRDRRNRGGPGKAARGPSVEPNPGELEKNCKPLVSSLLQSHQQAPFTNIALVPHRPCTPLTAPPCTPRQHRKNLEDGAGARSQPGLDERLEMEKREGLSSKAIAGLGMWSLSGVGIYKC